MTPDHRFALTVLAAAALLTVAGGVVAGLGLAWAIANGPDVPTTLDLGADIP